MQPLLLIKDMFTKFFVLLLLVFFIPGTTLYAADIIVNSPSEGNNIILTLQNSNPTLPMKCIEITASAGGVITMTGTTTQNADTITAGASQNFTFTFDVKCLATDLTDSINFLISTDFGTFTTTTANVSVDIRTTLNNCEECDPLTGQKRDKTVCPPEQCLNPETCECEDVPPTPPVPPPGDPDGPGDDRDVPVPRSIDPNEKRGPAGFSEERLVAGGQLLPYTIYFENMPDATAPAQQVRITDQIDPNLDWRTFRLKEIGFGDQVISIPENRSFYQTRLDLGSEHNNLLLDIDAGINIITGQAHWILTTIDPATGEQPENPLDGFLPPNDPNHIGEGYVTFTIKSDEGLASGTKVINRATIIFDRNEPIVTNDVFNIIDGQAPSSQIGPLDPQLDGNSIHLSWAGADDSGGSGLDDYSIYASRDNGPYSAWLTNTKDTSGTFVGEKGHSYSFYSLAKDHAGNIEDTPIVPDALTYLLLGDIDISGEIIYTGPQTGAIYVQAYTDANFIDSPVAQTPLDAPCPYTITQIPGENIYYLRAHRDSNDNGVHDNWEAFGLCPLNPILPRDMIDPVGKVTGANITLIDPDLDEDGLPDWWERQIIEDDLTDSIQSIQDVLPVGDYDLDGLSNEAEYFGGSGPCDPGSLAEKPAGDGPVRIENGGLLVDENPYTIKGVIYLPTPIGHHPATCDVYQPEHYNRDLPLIRQMGCNTIVAWPGINKLDFLDTCWNDGINPIRVIMGYWIDPSQDLSVLSIRQAIVDDFKAYVNAYYDHPAVLMWQVCGRLINWYQGDPADWYTLINALGWAAYQIEGSDYHPVTNDYMEVADIGKVELYTDDAHLTGLDCLGVGAMPASTFGDLFTDYAAGSSKPCWIFGFGMDAWDHTSGLEDEYTQAKFDGDLWNEISAHLDICIGGAVKEYSDQWWISDPENIDQWATHEPGPYESPDLPDGWIDAEYYGLVRLTPGDNGAPDQVTPRLAYYLLSSQWCEGNDPPMAVDTYVAVNEDEDVNIALLGLDGDSDSLVFSIIDEPAHGSLGDIFENIVSYIPGFDYNGQDLFTFTASDGTSDSNLATVFITILPINDPPVVLSLSPVAGEYKDPVAIEATFQDIEGDEILSIEYEYSLDNGQTWVNIGKNIVPSSSYEWLSGLNSASVFIKAKAYDGYDWGAWHINASGFLIDNLPPVTTDDAPQGWQYQCMSIHLTPSDTGAGFDGTGTTYYFLDGNTPQEGQELSVCEPGIHELRYHSIDDVGNQEETRSINLNIGWDQDEDGYYDEECGGTDCNDTDPNINPSASEICDGIDNDCDGKMDEDLTRGCSTACGTGTETCQAGQWVNCTAPPVEPEVCNDKVDNNCNGLIDEGCIYQKVSISPETRGVQLCGNCTLTIYYDCNDNTSGLGLNIHFNSSKFEYIDYDNFLDKGDLKSLPTLTNDIDDEDDDPNTDMMLNMSWASVSSQWPGEALSVVLTELNFIMNCDLEIGQETWVNITSFENDVNCNFVGSGAKIIVNPCSFDIDDNGEVKALTDGLLIMRYLFRYPQLYGDGWIDGVVAPNCACCTPQDTEDYIKSIIDNLCFDIDDNGEVKALTDGLLIMRYLFRYPQLYGDGWIDGVVAGNCGRCTAQEIESYISSLILYIDDIVKKL